MPRADTRRRGAGPLSLPPPDGARQCRGPPARAGTREPDETGSAVPDDEVARGPGDDRDRAIADVGRGRRRRRTVRRRSRDDLGDGPEPTSSRSGSPCWSWSRPRRRVPRRPGHHGRRRRRRRATATGGDGSGRPPARRCRSRPATRTAPATGASSSLTPIVIDTFDRADDPDSLGDAGEGGTWDPVAGTWGIRDDAAVTSGGAGEGPVPRRRAPADGRGDGLTEVTMTVVEDGAGLVFRYLDPQNYWSIVANPGVGTWTVNRTIDGDAELAGELPGPTNDNVTISVEQKGSNLRFLLDGVEYADRRPTGRWPTSSRAG